MSTYAAVARPLDNGFEGRYVHSDGSPRYLGVVLVWLVVLHGVDDVRRVLIDEHYGWSLLDPYRSATDENSLGERAVNVPGWGLAYTDTPLTHAPWGTPQNPYRQTSAGDWCRHDNDPDVDYTYVLNDNALTVLQNQNDGQWDHLGDIPYAAAVTPYTVEQHLHGRRPARDLALPAARVGREVEPAPERWSEALTLRETS